MARQPDFEQFLKVLTRQGTPTHLPFYEHIASSGFIRDRLGVDLNRVTGRPTLRKIFKYVLRRPLRGTLRLYGLWKLVQVYSTHLVRALPVLHSVDRSATSA